MNAMSAEDEEIQLHQLHDVDHRRIRHEKSLSDSRQGHSGEIVMGYQYKRGKYVEIEPHELDRLRTDAEKGPQYRVRRVRNDRSDLFRRAQYYLLPDGPDAEEPYGVLYLGMERMNRYAVGQILFSGKDARPAATVPRRAPDDDAPLPRRASPAARLQHAATESFRARLALAESLVEAATDRGFDLSRYEDRDKERLRN